jgi:hypothetical protein
MILYRGSGDANMVTVSLIGDGSSKSVEINLSKTPFHVKFDKMFPRHWRVRMTDGPQPSMVSMQNAKLHLEFAEALPETTDETASPHAQLEFYMYYGQASHR